VPLVALAQPALTLSTGVHLKSHAADAALLDRSSTSKLFVVARCNFLPVQSSPLACSTLNCGATAANNDHSGQMGRPQLSSLGFGFGSCITSVGGCCNCAASCAATIAAKLEVPPKAPHECTRSGCGASATFTLLLATGVLAVGASRCTSGEELSQQSLILPFSAVATLEATLLSRKGSCTTSSTFSRPPSRWCLSICELTPPTTSPWSPNTLRRLSVGKSAGSPRTSKVTPSCKTLTRVCLACSSDHCAPHTRQGCRCLFSRLAERHFFVPP